MNTESRNDAKNALDRVVRALKQEERGRRIKNMFNVDFGTKKAAFEAPLSVYDAAAAAVRKMMPFLSFAPLVFCSSKSGYNIRRTVDAIDRAAASASEKLPTGMLNRTIEIAAKKTLSPMVKGRRLKIYYGLQVSTNPQTIRFFVNDPKLVTPAYVSYMERSLRARFGLEGAPLRIFMKARQRKTSSASR